MQTAQCWANVKCCTIALFVPLDVKGCIWHFKKWQIHPFISKGGIVIDHSYPFMQEPASCCLLSLKITLRNKFRLQTMLQSCLSFSDSAYFKILAFQKVARQKCDRTRFSVILTLLILGANPLNVTCTRSPAIENRTGTPSGQVNQLSSLHIQNRRLLLPVTNDGVTRHKLQ